MGRSLPQVKPPPKPKRVLIVRLSSLGDVVHAATLVPDIERRFPDAIIDWVVEEAFVPLVQCFGGIHRVIPIALRRWRADPLAAWREIAAFWRALRADPYDVVLDVQGLIKSAVVTRIARGTRYGLANSTEGASYEPLARWAYDVALPVPRRVHVVERSRSVAARALRYFSAGAPRVPWLPLEPDPQDAPWADPRGVLLVHGAAKADKLLPAAFWSGIGRALAAQGARVLVPWGTQAERERAEAIAAEIGGDAAVLPRLPLDRLAAVMSRLHGAIGLDTGLSHMSATLGRSTVQIFLEDKSWQAGIGWEPRTAVLQAPPGGSVTPDEVLQAWARVA